MIFIHLSQQLQSLNKLLSSLDDKQYSKKIEHLGHASIGSHTRHIIELLQCAITGYHSGQIDYVNRSRDLKLESDRFFAQSVLQQLDKTISHPDRQLSLVTVEGTSNKILAHNSKMPVPILPQGSTPSLVNNSTDSGCPVNLKYKVCKRIMAAVNLSSHDIIFLKVMMILLVN